MERGILRYGPLAVIAAVVVFAILQLRQRRRIRSFREDPIGAIKDRSELMADRAQEATEEAIARIQDTMEELRDRMGGLGGLNRKRVSKQRKELNRRLEYLNDQAQSLLREVRANATLKR